MLYYFVFAKPSALCMPPFGMCRPVWATGPHPISSVRVGAEEGRGGENATPAETILKSVRISVPSGPAASLPQIVRVGNGTRRCNMALSLMNY